MTEQRSTARRLWIWATKPFVVAAWRIRDRRRFKRNFPVEWKTPGEIISLDLENFEDQDEFKLNKTMIEDLLPARDAALARSNRLALTGMIIFAFLAADYFSINVKISIPGVDVSDVKGVREFLIFFSSILTTMSLVAQNNSYTLDSAIKYIVANKFPEEIRPIYMAKYFWHENFSRYFPSSLPHLVFTEVQSRAFSFISYGILIAMFLYFALFFAVGLMISVDVWKTGGLGWLSRTIAFGAIVNSVLSWGYFFITRSKMPYRNYLKLQEVQVLEQIAPLQVEAKRQALYSDGNVDYFSLVNRGYLSGNQDLDFTHLGTNSSGPWLRRGVIILIICLALFVVF